MAASMASVSDDPQATRTSAGKLDRFYAGVTLKEAPRIIQLDLT